MKSRYLLLFLIIWACNHLPKTSPQITAKDLKTHVQIFADDKMEGRRAGSKFELLSAQYIAARFKEFGLQPVGDNYFQKFEFVSGAEPGNNNRLSFEGLPAPFTYDFHFKTLGFSASDNVEAEAVFAGYGIVAPSLNYNDYESIDVSGRIVILLQYSPEGNDHTGKFFSYSSLRKKAVIARERGAVAVIFVTGPLDDDAGDELRTIETRGDNADVGIPAIHVKRTVVEQWLAESGLDALGSIQQRINDGDHPTPDSFSLNRKVSMSTQVRKIISQSQNVAGVIPGRGKLKDEYLIIGGHYDHLGWGGPNSNSMVPEVHAIHNGADDNASGSSGVIELAEYFSHQPVDQNQRSLLFITFGGEEVGLLGSAYYTEHPLVPLKKTVAMINMDMIGRLHDNALIVGGAGTSSWWKSLVSETNSDSLALVFNDEGYASSDHQSFYLKDIPVLFYFTGAHQDYHRPTDDIDRINFPGMVEVVQLVARNASQILTRPEPPDFVKVEAPSGQKSSHGYSVTIGVIPDFAYAGEGLRISAARENAPAGKAGMQPGDTIIEFNGMKVLNIQDYMIATEGIKAGEAVPIVFLRGDQKISLMIVPEHKQK